MSQKLPYQRILAAYDGSDNAERALRRAIDVAKRSSAELRVVVVSDTVRFAGYTGRPYSELDQKLKQNAEEMASAALDIAKKAGVGEVYASAEEGQPADLILTLATEYKSDLIVVGRRGMRGLERFLMGSVSTAVINHAKCDVLIVK